jgi:hypothetical protein
VRLLFLHLLSSCTLHLYPSGTSKAWLNDHQNKLSPLTVILSLQTTFKLVFFIYIRKSNLNRL